MYMYFCIVEFNVYFKANLFSYKSYEIRIKTFILFFDYMNLYLCPHAYLDIFVFGMSFAFSSLILFRLT